jgi:citrate lyase subunit beta/citryl-CoA lyase
MERSQISCRLVKISLLHVRHIPSGKLLSRITVFYQPVFCCNCRGATSEFSWCRNEVASLVKLRFTTGFEAWMVRRMSHTQEISLAGLQAGRPSLLPCIAPLFVPADRPERFAKAAISGADAIIIDLEDAVAPARKAMARAELCRGGALPQNILIYVRLNARATPWYAEDMAAIAGLDVAGIILPKTESVADVQAVAAILNEREVIALIETAAGLAAGRQIAGAAGTTRLAFGSIDFCADLGLAHTREALLMARSELVLASRLGGLAAPLDGVTASLGDVQLAEEDARYAASLGFGGKLCIHPAQVAPVKRGFAPSEAEIAWAERVLAAGDDGAAAVDGELVDAPVRARAIRIMAQRS